MTDHGSVRVTFDFNDFYVDLEAIITIFFLKCSLCSRI